MAPYRKPFSPHLYGRYDKVAKETLQKHLEATGHVLVSGEESYNADLVTSKDGVVVHNEAEVKTAWKEDWPTNWAEIRIPERKKRLLEKHDSVDFYVFRNDMKQAWRIRSSQLTDERLKEANGRNIHKGEQFYHVPYQEAELVVIL